MQSLERLGISQRLDLQADYLLLTSETKDLGLTKAFRLRDYWIVRADLEREVGDNLTPRAGSGT
jgi:hypothetical protein